MRTCSLHGSSSILELISTSNDRNLNSSFYGFPKHPFARATPSLSFKSCHFSVRCAVSFRPCIDIPKGKVKRIVGSTLRDSKEVGSTLVTNFESDLSAAEYAKLYKRDGLKGGHVIMLAADPLSKAAAIEPLRAYPGLENLGGLQVGGGINLDNCLSYIEEGASHVIVTSEDKYAIVTDRWQKFSYVYLDGEVLHFLANYADEFLVHGVDVEGKKLGIEKDLVALLGEYSPIPVTYAGGVTVMDDLETIKAVGKGRVDVTVRSALDIFGGNLR